MTCDTKYQRAVTVESARTNIPGYSLVPSDVAAHFVGTTSPQFLLIDRRAGIPKDYDDQEISSQWSIVDDISTTMPIALHPILRRKLADADKFTRMEELISLRLNRTPQACRPSSRERRKRNKAFDLVGIESNPGPPKKVKTKVVERVVIKTQKPKQKKKGGSQSSRSAPRGPSFVAAPSGFGMTAPQSYFRQSSNAQRNTEQDVRGSVRVSGCALLRQPIALLTAASPVASSSFGVLGASPTSVAYRGYYHLNPNNIDTRLTAVANCYQFYAFRRIKAYYSPSVSTATKGSLHMAIVKDADTAVNQFGVIGAPSGNSAGSNSTLMDFDPAVTTTIWNTASVTMTHTGSRLWDTFQAGSDDIDDRIQASLVCLVSNIDPTGAGTGVPPASATTTYGYCWLEYDIDFYVPGPPTN